MLCPLCLEQGLAHWCSVNMCQVHGLAMTPGAFWEWGESFLLASGLTAGFPPQRQEDSQPELS